MLHNVDREELKDAEVDNAMSYALLPSPNSADSLSLRDEKGSDECAGSADGLTIGRHIREEWRKRFSEVAKDRRSILDRLRHCRNERRIFNKMLERDLDRSHQSARKVGFLEAEVETLKRDLETIRKRISIFEAKQHDRTKRSSRRLGDSNFS
ncbi:hypothetical protein Tcan_05553 [Toxocara canis]|uniref:Uncharacterized protein n=1 Tax=Toxocara canis TaxID=6265 RepID=A0A0B2USZ8_TOXCA|nr:hypothetical protein Tcan_05553 [Toxocara canis]